MMVVNDHFNKLAEMSFVDEKVELREPVLKSPPKLSISIDILRRLYTILNLWVMIYNTMVNISNVAFTDAEHSFFPDGNAVYIGNDKVIAGIKNIPVDMAIPLL